MPIVRHVHNKLCCGCDSAFLYGTFTSLVNVPLRPIPLRFITLGKMVILIYDPNHNNNNDDGDRYFITVVIITTMMITTV